MTTETVNDSSETLTTGELPAFEPSGPRPRRRVRLTVKLLLFVAVLYYFVVPLAPDFRDALTELRRVDPWLLVLGLGLEMLALYCYAPLMQAAQSGDRTTAHKLYAQLLTVCPRADTPGRPALEAARAAGR